MNGSVFVAALLLSSLWLSVSGQQPQQSPRPSPSPTPQNTPRDEDQDVVRINTNLVQVDVVVTKDGKQVTNLRPEDFEIFEDGKPQKITHFSYISNVPVAAPSNAPSPSPKDSYVPVVPSAARPHDVRRTVALVVDDLGMSFESMAQTRRQVRKFVDEQLQPNDLVAIIRTGGEVGSLQQFTTDKRLLHSALEYLKWNHCSRAGIYVFKPLGSPALGSACGEHPVMDTLHMLRFVLQGMRDLPGRKSMVVFSDHLPIQEQKPGRLEAQQDEQGRDGPSNQTKGGAGLREKPSIDLGTDQSIDGVFHDPSSNLTLFQKIAELAIRASVVIYAVDTRGLQYTGPTAADGFSGSVVDHRQLQGQINSVMATRSAMLLLGREGADLIARETGGFLIRNSNDFGLQRVMDDQQGYYLIGYRPNDETFNRRFHRIKVRAQRSGLTVRTREGFYGVTEDESRPAELTTRDQLNRALISPFGANDITVRLTTFFANEAAAGSLLRSFLYLDPGDLTFSEKPDGTREARFELSSILFGDNGKVISRQDQTSSLRLNAKAFKRFQREGIVYGFDMPVKQFGTFQFRVAVRDIASARIGAGGQFVEVPNLRNDRLALSGVVIRKDANPEAPLASNQPDQAEDNEITSGPAIRRFQQGSTLVIAYAVYNGLVDNATHWPQLTMQTHIFRDGKSIHTGNPTPVDVRGQTDLQRIAAGSRLQLSQDLPPGQYVLQIIVEDRLAKEKTRTATQWIDFEVVK